MRNRDLTQLDPGKSECTDDISVLRGYQYVTELMWVPPGATGASWHANRAPEIHIFGACFGIPPGKSVNFEISPGKNVSFEISADEIANSEISAGISFNYGISVGKSVNLGVSPG